MQLLKLFHLLVTYSNYHISLWIISPSNNIKPVIMRHHAQSQTFNLPNVYNYIWLNTIHNSPLPVILWEWLLQLLPFINHFDTEPAALNAQYDIVYPHHIYHIYAHHTTCMVFRWRKCKWNICLTNVERCGPSHICIHV